VKLKFFRDAVRAKEIVGILLKYRFDEILEKTDTPASWLTKLAPPIKGPVSLPQRVRMAMEELGPTFVKMGQILSTRPDAMPRDVITELEKLRDKVKTVPFETIQPVLERELNQPIEDVFTSFNEEPFAAGSLAQIYKAKLKENGEWVVIKIQRPGIRSPIRTDFEILEWLAGQIHENIMALRAYELPSVVAELKQAMMNELDFNREARNANTFNSLNQFPHQVFAPVVYNRYTTERLLVTEWIDGTSPGKSRDLETEESNIELARLGGNSFFSQIAVTGFFHGDPHPGNLLITRDNRVCFVDWGLSGQLTARMRYALIDLFDACNDRDAAKVTRIALQLGRNRRRIDRTQLEKSVTTILFKWDDSLRRMENLGNVILELIHAFGLHGIQVARDYTLLAKAVISIEESAHLLDPKFNLAKIAKPFIRQLNWERWNPLQIGKGLAVDLKERWTKLGELPEDLQRVLHRIEDEELSILLEHQGFDQASQTIHHAFSRLSLAVIIGALIIGSSFVINTGLEPLIWGYPALGLIGYLLSVTLGLYVAYDILRGGYSKKRKKRKYRRN